MSVYYNENDKDKAAWLRELIREGVIADGEVDTRSIAEVCFEDLAGFSQHHFFAGIGVWSYALRLAGWPDDRPVWTGSCPCPSFSAAGKGGGFDDPRHLWPDWARLIRKCRPATLFGEQADDAIGYGWLDLVQTDLEREDYAVGKAVLGACSVGAPHIRQRLYFVAHSAESRFSGDSDAGTICEGQTSGPRSTESERYGGNGGGLADSNGNQSRGRHRKAGDSREEIRIRTSTHANTSGQPISLANTDSKRCGEARIRAGESRSSGSGNHHRMADSDRRGQPVHRTAQRETGYAECGGESNMGESIGERLERHDGHVAGGNESRWFRAQPHGSATAAGFVNGFWRGADWVLRKRWNSENWEWCPTEPGTFPLATGVANRVLKLRGYGDAICAEVAKAFIEASMTPQPGAAEKEEGV